MTNSATPSSLPNSLLRLRLRQRSKFDSIHSSGRDTVFNIVAAVSYGTRLEYYLSAGTGLEAQFLYFLYRDGADSQLDQTAQYGVIAVQTFEKLLAVLMSRYHFVVVVVLAVAVAILLVRSSAKRSSAVCAETHR